MLKQVTEWPSDRETKWPSDWVTKWLSDQVTERPCDHVTEWPSDRVTGWQEATQTIDSMVYLNIRREGLKDVGIFLNLVLITLQNWEIIIIFFLESKAM